MRRTACRTGPPGGWAREPPHRIVLAGPARRGGVGTASVPSDLTEARGAVCLALVRKVELAASAWQLPMADICLAAWVAIPSWPAAL